MRDRAVITEGLPARIQRCVQYCFHRLYMWRVLSNHPQIQPSLRTVRACSSCVGYPGFSGQSFHWHIYTGDIQTHQITIPGLYSGKHFLPEENPHREVLSSQVSQLSVCVLLCDMILGCGSEACYMCADWRFVFSSLSLCYQLPLQATSQSCLPNSPGSGCWWHQSNHHPHHWLHGCAHLSVPHLCSRDAPSPSRINMPLITLIWTLQPMPIHKMWRATSGKPSSKIKSTLTARASQYLLRCEIAGELGGNAWTCALVCLHQSPSYFAGMKQTFIA